MKPIKLVVGLVFCFVGSSIAQDWVFSRDDKSSVIDRKNDTIVVTLLTARVTTKNTFLTTVNEAGVVVQGSISGDVTKSIDGQTRTDTETAEYPLAYTAPVRDKVNNQANLPFQFTFVRGLPLTNGKTQYTNLSIAVTLLKKEDPNVWTKVFQKLLAVTSAAAVPGSPLAVGAKYVSDFANGMIQDALPPGEDHMKKISLGRLSLDFGTDNKISQSGIYMLVERKPNGATGDGWIDPSNTQQYCFYTKFTPSTSILVGKKATNPNDPDKDSEGCLKSSYTPILNSYVPFLLQKRAAAPNPFVVGTDSLSHIMIMSGGEGAIKSADNIRKKNLEQCKGYGIEEKDCVAAKEE